MAAEGLGETRFGGEGHLEVKEGVVEVEHQQLLSGPRLVDGAGSAQPHAGHQSARTAKNAEHECAKLRGLNASPVTSEEAITDRISIVFIFSSSFRSFSAFASAWNIWIDCENISLHHISLLSERK